MVTLKRLNYRHIFLYLLVSALFFGAGWQAHLSYERYQKHGKSRRAGMTGYRFTSPLLDVELPEGFVIGREPIPFKFKVRNYIQKRIQKGRVQGIAVYYRDLHDGPWFAINKERPFHPASMMKVPIMIAWLKRAEREPSVLRQKMTFLDLSDGTQMQNIKPGQAIVRGRSYTVEELIFFMTKYSDNNAARLLFSGLRRAEVEAVLAGMDINYNPHSTEGEMTIHGYSGFFRILYNAAFLSRDMSERALQFLSEQDFSGGIVAGVPQGVTVSSKYGEYTDAGKPGEMELHEFGIVYHRTSPYILGIVTSGNDFAVQAEIIGEISRLIYEEVDRGTSIDHATGTVMP